MPEVIAAPARRLMLTMEVAAELGVSRNTVKALVRAGKLTPVPFSKGGWLRFWSDDVARLLDAHPANGPDDE